MPTKSFSSIMIYLLRVILLTFILVMGTIIGSAVSGVAASLGTQQNQAEASQSFIILLGVQFISAVLISFFLTHARWRGWRLVLALGIIYFGIDTFMPQLETLFFGEAMKIDNDLILKIILSGFITTVLLAPLAVLIFRKMKGASTNLSFHFDTTLYWKLPILAIIYIFLYLTFGYFVAWQSPAVRIYYTGSAELLSFSQHMSNLFTHDWNLITLQFIRGLLWAGLVLLILQCCNGKKWELALLSGLLLGLLLTVQLFLPNPLMPQPVRMVHFVETSTSTFLFGVIAALLFLQPTVKSLPAMQ